MPDYHFYKKGKHVVAVKGSDAAAASGLTQQGYEKQFEEIDAVNSERALARFSDIRRDKQTDHHNFMAGAIAMPLIGVLTAVANKVIRKKSPPEV
ncbi:hypothetical protein KXR87_09565 [Yokenella regensburgei]|uniref:hypothetical protein n=1 Tax=Yokenella regensburgei TaxID=158877 RepID=UPI003F174ACB